MENYEILGIMAIPAIVIICFLMAEFIKAMDKIDNKWLPLFCGTFGGCLGVVAMFIMPDYPAHDYISAIAIGIVSGLAATGAHQVYKQLTKEE